LIEQNSFSINSFLKGGKKMKSRLFLIASLVGLFFGLSANAQGHGGVLVERQILCASNGYNQTECNTGLDRTYNVYMARQLSKSACIQGQSYSIYGNRISVRNGCRAIFVAKGITSFPQGSDQTYGNLVTRNILCESQSYNMTSCHLPFRQVDRVYVGQQFSNSPCIQGQSYFVYGNTLQVSNGCRASFVVTGIQ
jgi:hypothetical protein